MTMPEPLSEKGKDACAELKRHCEVILGLLNDPHPGLISWCQALNNHWGAISKLYQEN